MITTIVKIDGMMCDMCEAHVNSAIRKNFDVKKVKANRKKKQALIESDDILDQNKLKQVVEELGYDYLGVE